MQTFDQIYQPEARADELLRPLLERLHQSLRISPFAPSVLKAAMLGVLEFLTSVSGRTDANCRTVDLFLMRYASWSTNKMPQAFVNVLADMSSALHDTISEPDLAAYFKSTPEQLLKRVRRGSTSRRIQPPLVRPVLNKPGIPARAAEGQKAMS